MKIGIMSAGFAAWPLEKLVNWASEAGFKTLEVCCWPAGEGKDRKYGGVVHIDVESLTPGRVDEIKSLLADRGMEITALGYYPNPLHPDKEHRDHVIGHLKKVILGAEKLGVGIVGTLVGRNYQLTGRDWQKSINDNLEMFKKTWTPIVQFAADHNVKIATEHCPMIWHDTWADGDNLPYSPRIMHRMFELLPSEHFGIMYDPSHFVWQMIDYVRFIYDFRDRIFGVHAQDMAIDHEKFYEDGILGCAIRWQQRRLPGQGLVDWQKLIQALYNIGYNRSINIEHEDPNWEGSEDLLKRGYVLAKKTLEIYAG
jgi:sugar phosphate isomerase/epimerase